MNQSSTDQLLARGEELFKKGDYKKAQKVLSEVIEVDEKNVDAYFYLANIFHLKGEIGKAIKAFNKVISLDPNHTDASISLSVLYNDIGKYEQAQKIFDVANERVKSRPTSSQHGLEDKHVNKKFAVKHFELAEMYLCYNRFDEALFEFNKVVALDPDNLDARIKVAKVYSKKGFVAKAFDELRKLKNEHPSFIPARIALGILHYSSGNILEAQTEWEKVLIKYPGNEEAMMYLNLSRTATETSL